jgi:hypothetical protein
LELGTITTAMKAVVYFGMKIAKNHKPDEKKLVRIMFSF